VAYNQEGNNVIYTSATQHACNIESGVVSAEELTKSYLARINQLNPTINAIVAQDQEHSLLRAMELDQLALSGRSLGPLHGVPVTVKECFNVKGFKTTVNYPPLKNYRPSEDSILVSRLKDAGAILLGKTNVPTLLADSQTFGPLFPTANNPYDLTRSTGGSTGGGAAAVATGMTTFEIGSDIAGSIRNPAHYCGLFGLKPTQNGHPADGHVPPLPDRNVGYLDMNSTGPLARTMDDIELAYNVCYAPRWDYLRYLPIDREFPEHKKLSDFRIGWFDEILGIQCSTDTKKALEGMVSSLESAGAQVEKIKIDQQLLERILKLWAKIFGFVIGQDFSWPMRQLLKLKFQRDLSGSKLEAKRELHQGLSLNFKQFSSAQLEQQELTAELTKLFEAHDFLLSPTSAGPAFEHNQKHKPIPIDGDTLHYSDYCFSFVMPYNVTRLPVLTVPTGLNDDGLPIGLSFAGPHFSEKQLIRFGKLLESAGYRFQAPPEISL